MNRRKFLTLAGAAGVMAAYPRVTAALGSEISDNYTATAKALREEMPNNGV